MINGYKEAQEVDEKFNAIILREHITKENAFEWIKFSRTIKTSALIIEEEAKAILFKAGYYRRLDD